MNSVWWLIVGAGYIATILAVGRFLSWKWHPDQESTEVERIDPRATEPALDVQDYTVLLSLCESAMLDEPYTNRAVFLAALIDRLETQLLAL